MHSMYNVLLVDDERIIREGLAGRIAWHRYGLALFGEAANGKEGLDKILQNEIHIVITDIKMPGIDGLELIRRAMKVKPDLRFIVLSGYDEFEFAQQAMHYGVRHYLLKPTKMQEIDKILREVSGELAREQEARGFIERIKATMSKNMPLIKEQFLRDLIMHKVYTSREMGSYLSFFGIAADSIKRVILLLFSPVGEQSYEKLFSLQLICQQYLEEKRLILATIIKEDLAVVIREMDGKEILEKIGGIKSQYNRIYSQPFTVAISGAAPMKAIHTLYEETRNCLKYRFCCGEDGIITRQDTTGGEGAYERSDLQYYIEEASLSVKCGNESDYRTAIADFWAELKIEKLPQRSIHNAIFDLLLTVARYNQYENLGNSIDCLKQIEETTSLEELVARIDQCCVPVVRKNFELFNSKKNRLVEKMKEKIRENIANPDLTLKWLANTMIYANVDYLSKLFKRETGEPFKHFVNRLRVEDAKSRLEHFPEMPMYEIVRDAGFGDNNRYFCLVFRKYTGQSPSEYRRRYSSVAKS